MDRGPRDYHPGMRAWLVLALIAGCGAELSVPCVSPEEARAPTLARPSSDSGRIAAENAREGSDGWQIDRPTEAGVEGYVDRPSLLPGESLRLFVRTASAPRFSVEVWRMGWYGGRGGRRVLEPLSFEARAQPPPTVDPETQMVSCAWASSATITAGADWVTGVYLVKLTALPYGTQRYVPFVVRDDQAQGTVVFQTSLATYVAYNDWGGRSTYGEERSRKVSLDRPFARGSGAGDFFAYELPTLRFLEREGLPLSYVTSLDVHRRGQLILGQRAFLSVGHDEYWSLEVREALEAARGGGVHLGFLGANIGYWSVRFEPSAAGAPDRVMVAYKEAAALHDPLAQDARSAARSTGRWRDDPINRPESALLGVQYQLGIWGFEADWVAEDARHWMLEGTGLSRGSVLRGLVGGEGDQRERDAPACVELLGGAEVTTERGRHGRSESTIYVAESGSWVFAWGSYNLGLGLDPTEKPDARTSAEAQRIVRNYFRRVYR